LKVWDYISLSTKGISCDPLPISFQYDSSVLTDELVKEINLAASRVMAKHIPLAEQLLKEVCSEEFKETKE
jgi:hypothetical protein